MISANRNPLAIPFFYMLLGLAGFTANVGAKESQPDGGSTKIFSEDNSEAVERQKPNILIWVVDDVGFGQLSSFGGLVETPNIDKVAQEGLRFTNFHASPLCSPTRAALLTGRNPHAVSVGTHAYTPTEFPGYHARIPKSAATIARILKDGGYATYALGKWDHLRPEFTSAIGPFDYWPSGQGFEHFYGFLHYDAHQFMPAMWSDHTPVNPHVGREDYHLSTDMADSAIASIEMLKAVRPDQPFFMYWATGAVHTPHHAPKEYIKRYAGRFDMGYEAAGEVILARQKQLEMVPQDVELPPFPEEIPKWDSLSLEQQQIAARAMEVFAAQLTHADYEFGRIVDTLDRMGELDNTVIVILSDNGATAEGTPFGVHHSPPREGFVSWDESQKFIDQWGAAETYPNYPMGWAAAGNTPFKGYKQDVYEGGVRVPLIMKIPGGESEKGVRQQYHFITDVFPTLLELADISPPLEIDGVLQQKVDGKSMTYAINDSTAKTERNIQYYELWGNRGIWNEGWKAIIRHRSEPWLHVAGDKTTEGGWELYNLNEDFNEVNDLAPHNPEKLDELKSLFHEEALANNVYPLLPDYISEKKWQLQRLVRGRSGKYVYQGGEIRIPATLAPPLTFASHFISANIEIMKKGANGAIVAFGGAGGGYSLYMKNGRIKFASNRSGVDTSYIKSSAQISPGRHFLEFELSRSGESTGVGVIRLDGKVIGTGEVENLGVAPASEETFDIGRDTGSKVVSDYQGEGVLDGAVEGLTIQIKGL